jgi:hypothetical protein
MKLIGISSKGHAVGTKRGDRLATSLPPDYSAETIEDQADGQHLYVSWKFQAAALCEVTLPETDLPEPDIITGEAERIEIETLYGRKIAGLRQLPKRERSHARKAAKEWRTQALKALQEKRAVDRHARRAFRRLLKLELR